MTKRKSSRAGSYISLILTGPTRRSHPDAIPAKKDDDLGVDARARAGERILLADPELEVGVEVAPLLIRACEAVHVQSRTGDRLELSGKQGRR